MHWLEKWRKDHQFSREQLAKEVGVSEALIWILENMRGGITHPLIADEIADYTGATAKQRDSLVHKKHRDTWSPDKERTRKRRRKPAPPKPKPAPEPKPEPQEKRIERRGIPARPILMVNMDGEAVARYDSLADAARCNLMDNHCVYTRCRHVLKENEFLLHNSTFRYEDEYDDAAAECVRIMGREAMEIREKGAFQYGGSWYLTVDGKTQSLREWSRETGIKAFTLLGRIHRGMSPKDAVTFKDMRGGNRNGNHDA